MKKVSHSTLRPYGTLHTTQWTSHDNLTEKSDALVAMSKSLIKLVKSSMTKIQNCGLQFDENTETDFFLVSSKHAGDIFKLLCPFEKTGTLYLYQINLEKE